ncbi:MAG: hypothetical protein JO250_18105 [Armatimonadetes bacterium]|nr:hypothetical protein [Armatimonadota bacterium]
MAAGKLSIGYVLSLAVADSVFMGGAMVTDPYGLPLEFRYTEPVRATRLQRVLYGDVLEKYIHGDVIVANLVGRLEQKPDIVLVSDPTLLPVLETAGRQAAALSPGRVPPLKDYGAQQEVAEGDFFLQLTDSGSPVRVRLAPGGAADAARKDEAARILTEIGRTMDALEPLVRVEAAVRMLWDEAPEAPPA